MSGRCYVFCPNAKCFAQKHSQEGDSWRYMHGHGGSNPKNCRSCCTAFKFSPDLQRWTKPGGTQGGKPTNGAWKSRWPLPGGNSDGDPARKDKPQEHEQIRKALASHYRAEGLSAEDAQAKVDQAVPPKPLSLQEQREDLEQKLQKAKKHHGHMARQYESMYNSCIRQATALLEYEATVEVQKLAAEEAKVRMEDLQFEFDQMDASTAAPAAADTSVNAMVARKLAAKLPGVTDAQQSAQVRDAIWEIIGDPSI